jgi:hypothetical protein
MPELVVERARHALKMTLSPNDMTWRWFSTARDTRRGDEVLQSCRIPPSWVAGMPRVPVYHGDRPNRVWSPRGPEGNNVKMVGLLSQHEIEAVLRRGCFGRIGCCIENRPYVVPVRYAYDASAVYVASGPGQKIDAMRADPHVCFEVDEAHGTAGWSSVIADGAYVELTADSERRAALALLDHSSGGCPASGPAAHDGMIIFRMDLTEKTGRFGRE